MIDDNHLVSLQLGRPLLVKSQVVLRCSFNLPVVVRVPPLLEDGTPFPTRYWLTCPLAHRRVARLEARGEITRAQKRMIEDRAYRISLDKAHERYERDRNQEVPMTAILKPQGGIAGIKSNAKEGVKCLHAHLAHHLIDGDNPVGRDVEQEVMPLNCVSPCCIENAEDSLRNPAWREPSPEKDL